MARLPGYENQRSVSTGSEFMRARAPRDATGAGAVNFAAAIAGVGGQMQRVDDQLDAKQRQAQERIDKLAAEAEVVRADSDGLKILQEEQQNIREDGAGFTANVMRRHTELWQERVKNIPEHLRPEKELSYVRSREALSRQAATVELQQRNQFTLKVSNEKATSLATGITSGVMDHATARADVDKFVDTLSLPPNRAMLLKRQMGMKVDEAHILRQIELNPDGVLRDLKNYQPGRPRSSNPNVNTTIEAAERHGIPTNIMLAIVEGESKFDHTVDMSKKINPATGRPYSSAYGLGQMIDANWKEVGLAKSADPAIQAEATARLLSKRISTLQSNNIEVTPENVWGAHFVGPGGFVALMRANPNASLRDVLLPLYGESKWRQATTGNGTLLQDNATVGETLARIKAFVDRNAAAVEKRITNDPARDPTSVVEVAGAQLGYMTAQDANRYIGKAQEAVSKIRDTELQMWTKQQMDDGLINPFTSADRRAVDKWAASSGINVAMNQGDPQAYGTAMAMIKTQKYLPRPLAEEAEFAITSPDRARRQLGYELLSQLEIDMPIGGLQRSGVTGEMAKRVQRVAALRTQMNMPLNQAVALVEREFTDDFAERVRRDKTRVDNTMASITAGHFEAHFNSATGLFGWGGTVYGSPAAKERMLAQFQERVRYHLNDGAEKDTAIASAKHEMSRAYGVDNTFGQKRLMHWPPSKVLPTGEDGTHRWVSDAVTTFVNTSLGANGYKFKVAPKDVFLIGTAETGRTAMAGQGVKYEVSYYDDKGRLQMLPGGFTVNPEEYRARVVQMKLLGEASMADAEGRPHGTANVADARRRQEEIERTQRETAERVIPTPAGAAMATPPPNY